MQMSDRLMLRPCWKEFGAKLLMLSTPKPTKIKQLLTVAKHEFIRKEMWL